MHLDVKNTSLFVIIVNELLLYYSCISLSTVSSELRNISACFG